MYVVKLVIIINYTRFTYSYINLIHLESKKIFQFQKQLTFGSLISEAGLLLCFS